ncbi:TIGR02677 family protein [Clostridium sp. DJ247]|uniref:TIGR02677 family protein n=1 Tax=Clostridium sp. DJ247 TaxID=2726188 RepID=UPI0016277D8B|nr:TIGR02677 family protein [Clostridium sp. DJ247]MBC2580033.1 TIGR02677 family protein [Clostridium sp. DJ247]
MDINSKLTKQIDEMRYLTVENAWRYRVILRYFYLQYEKMKYWMYKEEVFEELKKHEKFMEYTMDQCKQDLDVLISWRNLLAIQDTSKVATVEEFKNKQFRYQLSEYSVEIERLTIKLENLFVESASLEPSLLERIKEEIEKLPQMANEDNREVGSWWSSLNNDFKRLNQNYQDYIRDLYSLKAEEMMKTREFLVFKDKFIDYLRDFIKGLQYNSNAIEYILKQLEHSTVETVLEKAFAYEKSIPRIDLEISDEVIKDNIYGRWNNLKEWFLGSAGLESEASKLLNITNEIIRKITRFASQIAESRNSAANRKEEYKKLCEMFLNCDTLDEAHKLSSLAFGIFNMKHIKGEINRKTESINSGIFEEEPYIQNVKPRIRAYKEKNIRNPIVNNEKRKSEMLHRIIKIREEERRIIDSYIVEDVIDFSRLPEIEAHVRLTLLRWLSKGVNSPDNKGKTEDGRVYKVENPKNKEDKCKLLCADGIFEMPAYIIRFERVIA